MSGWRKILLAVVCTGLLAGAAAAENHLNHLAVSAVDSTIEVELTGSDSTAVRYFALTEGEPRLVLDFYDTVHALDGWNHPQHGMYPLTAIRSSQFKPRPGPRTRVVLDLAEVCRYEVVRNGQRTLVRLWDRTTRGATEGEMQGDVAMGTSGDSITISTALPAPAPSPGGGEEPRAMPIAVSPPTPVPLGGSPFQARLRGVHVSALEQLLRRSGLEADLGTERAGDSMRTLVGDVSADDPRSFLQRLRALVKSPA